MSFRILTAGLLVLGVSLCAQPRGNYIILDLSSSTEMVTAADAGATGNNPAPHALWLSAAERQVLSKLQFGDTLTILPVRGTDLLSAPLLDEMIPELKPSDGLTKQMRAKQKRKAIQDAARNAITTALASAPRANATALMATLGRVRVNSRTRVLVLSDALESTNQTVDLERIAITKDNVAAMVSKALKGALLPHDLAGAQIQFVLPGNVPKKPPVNSAPQLRLFWEVAIRSLQGTLSSFDAQIVPWQ